MGWLKDRFEKVRVWMRLRHITDFLALVLLSVWLFQSVLGTWYYFYAQNALGGAGMADGGFNVLVVFNITVCLAALPTVVRVYRNTIGK